MLQEDIDIFITLAECFVKKYGLETLPIRGKDKLFMYSLVPDFDELFYKQVKHKSYNQTSV